MKTHECNDECPRCGNDLSLTTETGWHGDDVTAVLCCPECRVVEGWSETAAIACHAATEEEALAGIDVDELLDQMTEAMAAYAQED